MGAVDKAKLLAQRTGDRRTVTVPGVGDVVVRGLTRAEVLSIQKKGEVDVAEMEALLVSFAMVEPEMTLDEVKQWQTVAPAGELEPISRAIQELSGLEAVAVKEQMKRFR